MAVRGQPAPTESYIATEGLFKGLEVHGQPASVKPNVASEGLFAGLTVRQPRASFVPKPNDLRDAKAALSPLMEVNVPHSEGISITRAKHQTGADFATFAERTRCDLTILDSMPTEHQMLSDIGT